jgi:hypothetical protein
VGAVIGLWNWNLNDRGQPAEISPEILRALPVWGGVTINTDDQSMWKVDLVLKQAGKAPMISLPLAAYCAWRHPNTNPSATLDSWNVKASVEYREEKPEVLQSVTKYDTVPLSAVRAPENIRPSDKEMGIFADSLVGYYALRLMPREPLERATTPYEDVMAMNKDQLAEWARGKLILVGDFRVDEQGKGDWYVAPDSKPLWGPQAQALAIDSLLRDVMPARYPHPLADYLMLLGGAALGVFAAGRRFGSAAMRLLAAAGLAALLVGACLLGFRLSGYLCQPLGAIIALALAFCAWLWFDPLYQHPRTEALPHRRTAS